MTLEEVAAYLRVHSSTVYRLLKRRGIPAFKMGNDWRFVQESIEEWVMNRESSTGEQSPELRGAARLRSVGSPGR
jgi:excisionase family DNA binding protein